VTAGKVKTGVNASFAIGGSIAGTVSGSAAKNDGAIVYAYRLAGDGEFEYGGGAIVGDGGKYKVNGLTPGKYVVQFLRSEFGGGGKSAARLQGPAPLEELTPIEVAPLAAGAKVSEKWWKDKPDAESANRISVSAKKTTPKIDTNLDTKPKTQKLKTATPKISGTAKVGKKLTAKAGTWTKGATLTYQWYAGGKAIAKATKSTFTLTKSQKGKTVTVKVTGAKAGYKKASKTSKATAKVR